MLYQVQYGDSPAKIARKFGVSMHTLVGANPTKPVTVVAGVPTWSAISVGETVNVPLGGIVGQPVSAESKKAAIESLMFVGGPCIETNVAVVCGVQAVLGVSSDGKWGSGTSTEARKYAPNAPAGCSPRPAWWAPRGVSNCSGDMPIPRYDLPPEERPPVTPAPPSLSKIEALLTFDPCLEANVFAVCAAQNVLVGATVDGKYGNDTATAARAIVPNAPPGCSPRPAWWSPPGVSNCTAAPPPPPPAPEPVPEPEVPAPVLPAPVVPAPPPAPVPTPAPFPAPVPTPVPPPTPIAVPAAVQALLTFNPCAQANVMAVCAAQAALGAAVDGKYGNDTATAARSLLPGAPAGCSPRPAWWYPAGQSNCVPKIPAPVPVPVPTPGAICPPGTVLDLSTGECVPLALPPAPVPVPVPVPTPGVPVPVPTPGEIITPPEKKGLSTGAIAAGVLGVAAVVGITAVAITKKGKTTTKRRRPTKKKKTKRRKKRK